MSQSIKFKMIKLKIPKTEAWSMAYKIKEEAERIVESEYKEKKAQAIKKGDAEIKKVMAVIRKLPKWAQVSAGHFDSDNERKVLESRWVKNQKITKKEVRSTESIMHSIIDLASTCKTIEEVRAKALKAAIY